MSLIKGQLSLYLVRIYFHLQEELILQIISLVESLHSSFIFFKRRLNWYHWAIQDSYCHIKFYQWKLLKKTMSPNFFQTKIWTDSLVVMSFKNELWREFYITLLMLRVWKIIIIAKEHEDHPKAEKLELPVWLMLKQIGIAVSVWAWRPSILLWFFRVLSIEGYKAKLWFWWNPFIVLILRNQVKFLPCNLLYSTLPV